MHELHWVPTEEEFDAAIKEAQRIAYIQDMEYEIACLEYWRDTYAMHGAYDLEAATLRNLDFHRRMLREALDG